MTEKVDVRVTVTLPDGRRQQFGYAYPWQSFERIFQPLPSMRELDRFSAMEAQEQRHRREHVAKAIAAALADIILTAAEYSDTRNGYERS